MDVKGPELSVCTIVVCIVEMLIRRGSTVLATGYDNCVVISIIVLHFTFHFKIFHFNRWIMYIEKKICECDGTIIMYHENIRRIKRR